MAGEGLIEELRKEIQNNRVVAVLGAGVSQAASGNAATAGWYGLLKHGLKYCLDMNRVNQAWHDRKLADLNEGDTDDWILVASAIEQKLGAPENNGTFSKWLRHAIGGLKLEDRKLIDAILALNIPIFTLNYDRLVEEASGLHEITWRDQNVGRLLRESGRKKVVHMHGYFEDPESVVLGLSSYSRHAHDKPFAEWQKALRTMKNLLFIGCGATLEDPNWKALLEWSRTIFRQQEAHDHYALFRNNEIGKEKREKYLQYRIELIGYGDKHEDLPDFLRSLAPPKNDDSTIDLHGRTTPAEAQIIRYCEYLEHSHRFMPRLLFSGQTIHVDNVYVELELDSEISDGPSKFGQASTTLLKLLQDRPSHRWVVLGDPGAGKSTLARYLVRQLALERQQNPKGGPLPVFADLPSLIDAKQHPFELAQAELATHLGTSEAADFAQELYRRADCTNGVWLFLDGLDELSSPQATQLRNRLESWEANLRQTKIVIFSRSLGYIPPGTAFEKNKARIKKLSDTQQEQLLHSWLGDEAIVSQLWSQLQSNNALQDACRTPFLLSLLAFLAKYEVEKQLTAGDSIELPRNRIGLYRRGIQTLLQRGHSYSGEVQGIRNWQGAYQLLVELALRLQESSGENWKEDVLRSELLNMMSEHDHVRMCFGTHGSWDNPNEFLQEVASKSGVIAPYDVDKDQAAPWRFLHRQFKELLVAEALHKQGDQALIKRAKKLDAKDIPRWAESLGFACEMAADPLEVLKQLAEVSQDLALRVLPEIEGIDHVAALSLLLEQGEWDGDYLLDLIRRWTTEGGLQREQAKEWLWKQVSPQRSTEELAYFHYALHYLDPKSENPPDRKKFFEQCKRWPKDGLPQLDWKKIPENHDFQMGAPEEEKDSDNDERPVHSVQLDAFELAATPVTNEQYRIFDNEHPGTDDTNLSKHPVVGVSWWEAYLCCHWFGGCLPTEAQWEYACRAGTTTRYWSGDDEADLAKVGWYGKNAGDRMRPVGDKPANPFGLHDMHGNVWEWCQDGYGSYEQPTREKDGLREVESAEVRVVRGGGGGNSSEVCRSASRDRGRPRFRDLLLGFRPARLIP